MENKSRKFPFPVSSRLHLWIIAIVTLTGVAGGFAYYALIGCKTGSCAITSNPYLSMVWGGAMGYLLGDLFVSKKKQQDPVD